MTRTTDRAGADGRWLAVAGPTAGCVSPLAMAALDAARELGLPEFADLCAPSGEPGYGLPALNAFDGLRWNSAFAYLAGARTRPNLIIMATRPPPLPHRTRPAVRRRQPQARYAHPRAARQRPHRAPTTYWHPVGTCAAGTDQDPAAVVDAVGRVRGMANLHVIDASILPTVPAANTQLPVLAVAEMLPQI